MDYQTHIDNLQKPAVAFAKKAIDFLDGDQQQHMIDLLNTDGIGIKKWRERGVMVLWENITNKIIDKSSQTYQTDPERVIPDDEAATEAYKNVLHQSNFSEVSEDIDQLSRLLKMAAVIVQYSEETGSLFFEQLTRANSDIDYNRVTGEVISCLYRTSGTGESGGDLYRYWTVEEVIMLEMDKSGQAKEVSNEDNTYKIVPLAILFDIKPPRYGIYAKPSYEQLILLNEAVNMFHIEAKFNQRSQAFGTLFTNAIIPAGTVFGPDAVVKIESQGLDEPTFVEYRSPSIAGNIEAFLDWLRALIIAVGDEWGVNIKAGGVGSADSGFKLVVEELPTLQLRKKRQKPAASFEQSLFTVVKAISDTVGLGVTGDEVTVSFPAPDLPVDTQGQWLVNSGEIAMKLKSREQYIKEKYPEWTADQVDEYLAEIDSGAAALPDFSGLADDNPAT